MLILEREREGEKHLWLPLVHAIIGDLTCNLGMCPDWNRTSDLLVYRRVLQPNESHRHGLYFFTLMNKGVVWSSRL